MMKKIIHLFFPVIMLSLFSCHDTEAKHEMEEPDFDGFVKISLQSQITGVQPMTGIVLWADNAKRNTDAISLEYSYMQYKDIVKGKGVYDWTPLEQILDAVASRKHQAIIRFWYTYPGYESAVPQYIRELPDYEETVWTHLRNSGHVYRRDNPIHAPDHISYNNRTHLLRAKSDIVFLPKSSNFCRYTRRASRA